MKLAIIVFLAFAFGFGYFGVDAAKIEITKHISGIFPTCVKSFVECLKNWRDLSKCLFGKEENNQENTVKNWMNSFLNAEVKFGKDKNAKEFIMILDSANNMANLSGSFLVENCPEEKITNSKGEEVEASCKRYKMAIYTPPSNGINCGKEFEQKTYDGTVIKMRICHDEMQYRNIVAKNAYFMVIGGRTFELFDPLKLAGAPGGPRLDGVFSLSFSSPKIGKTNNKEKLKSGIEFLLEKESAENDKIATVYMEPFKTLDFFSKTKGILTVGEKDDKNCGQKWSHFDIVDQDDSRWHITMEASKKYPNSKANAEGKVKIRPEVEKWPNQKAMISTTDIFIFAPESFTKPLFNTFKVVSDNFIFKIGRFFGRSGLEPRDVLIECPTKEEFAQLPELKFKFGDVEISLSPKEYIMPIVLHIPFTKWQLPVLNWCHPLIRPKPTKGRVAVYLLPDENKDIWIFGQLLYNKVCVEFNYTKRQIGMAPVVEKDVQKEVMDDDHAQKEVMEDHPLAQKKEGAHAQKKEDAHADGHQKK